MFARKCPVTCMQPQRNARPWFIFFQEIQRHSTGITHSWKRKYTLPVLGSLHGQRIFVMSVQCSFPRSSARNCQVRFEVRHLIDSYVMKFSSLKGTYEIPNELRKSPVKSFVKCTVIEVKTIGELSSGWPKGGRGRLREVRLKKLFYNYFGTLITDRFIERGQLMEVPLYSVCWRGPFYNYIISFNYFM